MGVRISTQSLEKETRMTKRPKRPGIQAAQKTPMEESAIDRELDDLYGILNYMRPAGSAFEEEMIEKFIIPLGAKPDPYGNYILRIWDHDTEGNQVMSPVLWSCHTDTVHAKSGRQKLLIDVHGVLSSDGENCLGADDSCGIWLMRRMIEAKIPGLYIFHREEEIGGHGSKFIANCSKAYRDKKLTLDKINAGIINGGKDFENKDVLEDYLAANDDLLEGLKYAIAFDRKALTSIITHQGARCCSDDFAESLALELDDGMRPKYIKDSGGTFTDTANYTGLIPECTNISVGYFTQHTPHETLNTKFIKSLMKTLLQFDWRNLVEKRKVTDKPEYQMYNRTYGGYYGGRYDEEDWKGYNNKWNNNTTTSITSNSAVSEEVRWVYMLVKEYPSAVTEILEDLGFDYDMLSEEIKKYQKGKIT